MNIAKQTNSVVVAGRRLACYCFLPLFNSSCVWSPFNGCTKDSLISLIWAGLLLDHPHRGRFHSKRPAKCPIFQIAFRDHFTANRNIHLTITLPRYLSSILNTLCDCSTYRPVHDTGGNLFVSSWVTIRFVFVCVVHSKTSCSAYIFSPNSDQQSSYLQNRDLSTSFWLHSIGKLLYEGNLSCNCIIFPTASYLVLTFARVRYIFSTRTNDYGPNI